MDTAELLVEEVLEHFGTKGMKWGVRKAPDSTSSRGVQNLKPNGVTIGKDGSISVKKGVNIQRLVRSDGTSLPMKDITYASINKYDNAKYIKSIGGKYKLLGGGRDKILSLQVTKDLKAPSKVEGTKIVSNLILRNKEFRDNLRDPFTNRTISDKEVKEISKNPTGKTATEWYENANLRLTFSERDHPGSGVVHKHFQTAFQAKGYNAVRDENDVFAGIAKAPLVIFSPEKTVRIVKTTQITDAVRKANKETLKSYKRNGKSWIEKELYGE